MRGIRQAYQLSERRACGLVRITRWSNRYQSRRMQLANGTGYLSEWKLENLPVFVKKLRYTDEVAVEVTGNTRLFYDAVAPHVARVVAVDPNQFRVISHSVKKTDPNDARSLALYLSPSATARI